MTIQMDRNVRTFRKQHIRQMSFNHYYIRAFFYKQVFLQSISIIHSFVHLCIYVCIRMNLPHFREWFLWHRVCPPLGQLHSSNERETTNGQFDLLQNAIINLCADSISALIMKLWNSSRSKFFFSSLCLCLCLCICQMTLMTQIRKKMKKENWARFEFVIKCTAICLFAVVIVTVWMRVLT